MSTDLIQTLVRAARARPLKPYEPLHVLSTRWSPGFPALVRRSLRRGWGRREGLAMRLASPVAWVTSSRSFDTHWHAWRPLDDLFNAHAITGDPTFLEPAGGFALDWLRTFQAPLLEMKPGAGIKAALKHRETQAWYDMSVALRLHRLSFLTDLALRDPDFPPQDLSLMAAGLDFHHRLLADDRIFRAHNNHGVFQALGQIAACIRLPELPRASRLRALAERRLERCLKTHFFPSGVHREHSPGYHLTLLDTLISAREHGLIGPRALALIGRAEEALGWMLTPSGAPAPLGDTDRQAAFHPPPDYVTRYQDPAVRALWTGGSAPRGVRAYEDAGYLFARGGEDGSDYLAQGAGFHSRTHKHADHLGVIWWARGSEILADPGRFAYRGKTAPGSALSRQGYWYDHPDRIHVERSRSHNVIEVDGLDHPRADVRPFGSALDHIWTGERLALSDSLVRLADGVTWRRVLVRAEDQALLILDQVRAPRPVTARQWFALGPEWRAQDEAGRFRKEDGAALAVRSLMADAVLQGPWRGRDEPDKRGWLAARPDRLEPAESLCFEAPRAPYALFVTLIAPGAVDLTPLEVRIDAGALTGRAAWRQDGETRAFAISATGRRRLKAAFVIGEGSVRQG